MSRGESKRFTLKFHETPFGVAAARQSAAFIAQESECWRRAETPLSIRMTRSTLPNQMLKFEAFPGSIGTEAKGFTSGQ